MFECGFLLSGILPYKYRIYNSALIRENMARQKPAFLHDLCSANDEQPCGNNVAVVEVS